MNTNKYVLTSIIMIGSLTSQSVFSKENDKQGKPTPVVLNDGWSTDLDENHNGVFHYVVAGILMKNSHTFPKTKVFKHSNGRLEARGRLEDYSYENIHQGKSEKTFTEMERDFWPDIKNQNAIYCPCCETTFNKENNETETIGALILGTRNPQVCQQFIQQDNKQVSQNQKSDIELNNKKTPDTLAYLTEHMKKHSGKN